MSKVLFKLILIFPAINTLFCCPLVTGIVIFVTMCDRHTQKVHQLKMTADSMEDREV